VPNWQFKIKSYPSINTEDFDKNKNTGLTVRSLFHFKKTIKTPTFVG